MVKKYMNYFQQYRFLLVKPGAAHLSHLNQSAFIEQYLIQSYVGFGLKTGLSNVSRLILIILFYLIRIQKNLKSQRNLDLNIEAKKLKEVLEIGEILNRNSTNEIEYKEIEKLHRFLKNLPSLENKFEVLSLFSVDHNYLTYSYSALQNVNL